MNREAVAVIGGGAWGSMLAHLLSLNHARVPLWVRDADLREELERRTHRGLPGLELSERIQVSDDIERVARGAELLFVAVPADSFRGVVQRLGEVVEGDQVLISGAKGLEPGSASRMSEIMLEETRVRQIGALGGPTYVEDMSRGSPAAAVIGSRFQSVVTKVQTVLASERIRVYGNADLLGVELGGALSTSITLACGLAAGLQLGPAILSVVINRGLAEIMRLGRQLGANEKTFQGLSLLGDVIAAAMTAESRDFKLGQRLAQGATFDQAVAELGPAESIQTTRMALELAARARMELPLIGAMNKALFEGVPAREILRGLMMRRNTYEW